MRYIRFAFPAVFVLLAACASLDFFKADKPIAQRIDDSRIVAAAYYAEIRDAAKAVPPLITVDAAEAQLAALDKVMSTLAEAESFLKAGDIATSEGKLKIVNAALLAVRVQLAKNKGEGK